MPATGVPGLFSRLLAHVDRGGRARHAVPRQAADRDRGALGVLERHPLAARALERAAPVSERRAHLDLTGLAPGGDDVPARAAGLQAGDLARLGRARSAVVGDDELGAQLSVLL